MITAIIRSPHPAHFECHYCAGLMRVTPAVRGIIADRRALTCPCGASVTETPMVHEGKTITYRAWTAPERERSDG